MTNEQAAIHKAAREWLLAQNECETPNCEMCTHEVKLLAAFHISQSEEERKRIQELEQERDELQQTLNLQQTRVTKVTKAWQARHGKPNVLPDLGMLIDWMWAESRLACNAAQEAEDQLETAEAEVLRLRGALQEEIGYKTDGPCQLGVLAYCRCKDCIRKRSVAALQPVAAPKEKG